DTIRTVWLNVNNSNIDIIQDVYPIDFTKSGQVVFKWRVTNHTGTPLAVACQYLEDVQITDPHAPGGPSNDGPTILTRSLYKPVWQHYPNIQNPLSWFYVGFLFNLPHNPTYDPGLSAMGIVDYGPPLNLTKAIGETVGVWYDMATYLWGVNPAWPIAGAADIGPDCAVLIEFSPRSAPPGQTVEAARTSYGTGEYERCIGNLFSIVFYPHHLTWTKAVPTGHYTPNPIHIEKFVVNAAVNPAASNTNITLTVKPPLTLVDSFCNRPLGQSQKKPGGNGTFIGSGQVEYFDWWACAAPAYYCTQPIIDTLVFTATCAICNPAFVDAEGDAECELPLTIDCAEDDLDPPQFSDTLDNGCQSKSLNFHDNLKSDRGLQSVTWKAQAGTDTNRIKVVGPIPPIQGCYNDKLNHIVTVIKNPANPTDSIYAGGYDFTFTDCLGHQSFKSVSLKTCPLVPHPDSLAPVFSLVLKSGTFDSTFSCANGAGDNSRIDSFMVTDNNQHDSGICKLESITGSVNNMVLNLPKFTAGDPIVRFTVSVVDSMLDGNICVRATDCSKAAHYSDTCIHYCPLPDITAPRIVIKKYLAGHWHVTVYDDSAWDRLLDTVIIKTTTPLNVLPLVLGTVKGLSTTSFDIITDSTQVSQFCIEARDLAGNWSTPDMFCGNQTVGKDTICPNILITPPLNTNPTTITVSVNDIHFTDPPKDSSRYVWDSGIDKVFFTANKGMITPPDINGNGSFTIPDFQISVANPSLDTVACVTINAIDKNGNICNETFCYPYTRDSLPPLIKLAYNPANKAQIMGSITDNTSADRGLDSVWLFHVTPGIDTNLNFNGLGLSGTPLFTI
ncbi:MAG: hypothetical protein ABI778_11110, partial [Ignavibacteriota bacterium]